MWFIFLCSTLPWLAGGLAVSLVFAFNMQKTGYPALLFGVGGLLGTIAIGLLAIIANWIGTNLIATWTVTALGLCCTACALSLYRLTRSQVANLDSAIPKSGILSLASFALIVVIASINLSQVIWVPTAGWDTLWSWAEISKNFIEMTQATPPPRWVHNETHPSTVAIISAWAGAYIPNAGGIGPTYLSWWLAWLSILLIIFGYTEAVTKNVNASALATLVSASIPLLTNHVILGGYAEIFLAGIVTGATATLALGLRERNGKLILLGTLLALSCVTLKNIGYVYSSCVLLAYMACLLLNKGLSKWFIFLVAISLLCLGLLGMKFNEQALLFEIGNRQLTLSLGNAPYILRNELISLFYNTSFSNTALLLFFPILILGTAGWNPDNTEAASFFLPWLTSLIMLGMLCASQLTDYGFLYAIPGNDTGNSRLSLPMAVCNLLLIGPLWSSAANEQHRVMASEASTKE